jgi:twitching motility two-component system response regulator PilG
MQTMPMQTMQNQYQVGGLQPLLENLSEPSASGTLYVRAQVKSGQNPRSRVLIWRDGKIVYGGLSIPDVQTFTKALTQYFKPSWVDSVLGFIAKRETALSSMQELLGVLVKLQVLEWKQAKDYMRDRAIWLLEQTHKYPVQTSFEPLTSSFELSYEDGSHGFDYQQLLQSVSNRQLQWQSLAPTIASMEILPSLAAPSWQDIPDNAVQKHGKQWIDGKNSLIDIAVAIDRDPLQIAQAYSNWMEKGWIKAINPIDTIVVETNRLPGLLAVDDSPIIQTMIKRALSSHYEVFQAVKALDALNALNQHSDRISLLILDLTMPDIDGLELCRTIRSMPKFKNLPIIMLTARDGFIDKVKGQLAGSDRYLTKPFEAEKLLEIVRQYI